jgi:hypothetical protein
MVTSVTRINQEDETFYVKIALIYFSNSDFFFAKSSKKLAPCVIFQINLPENRIVPTAKIRPIWSPCFKLTFSSFGFSFPYGDGFSSLGFSFGGSLEKASRK